MYLQSLELCGFKSFAARTLLEFHRGVTAVVGPNGCGKSNVLDAIRWVLGEQSAKALRGGEMADVIFGGTDSRQPLGMAEVSLTFTECEKELGVEWNEVRITRRVFRDGKSEYLINKTPCRLRDIHHLFMDTGIGRSAYSIMEQGKIDLILSSKPEDRRAIFEEAAGITKYKAQKKEALRKLDYTEANLLRVSDIIKEVKRQIGSLQRQAGKARRYQALIESLRTFDTHLSHRNFSSLQQEFEKIRHELEQLEEARGVHESEIAAQEVELTEHRSRLGLLDEQVGAVRDNVQTLRNRAYSAESRIESHQQRQLEFEELIVRNRQDVQAAEAKSHEQENQIQQTDSQIEELISTLRAGEEALSAQEAKVQAVRAERQSVEQNLVSLSSESSRLEGDIGRLRSEISGANARREAADARLAMLHGEQSSAAAANLDVESRAQQCEQRVVNHLANLEAAQQEATAATESAAAATTARQVAEAELTKLDRKLTEVRSRLDILQQLEASGEGLGEATQAVLRGLDEPDLFQPAIVGALANLIQVESRYVHAIEALLGNALQTVVFKDASVAEAALQVLAKGENGRGAILPREWVPTMAPQFDHELPQGALAWAKDCLQIQPELEHLVGHFLDAAVIVPDLDSAIRLRLAQPGFSYVTLAGELLTREGIAYSGSGQSNAASALLRKNEIAALQQELNQLTSEHQALEARLAHAHEALETANAILTESRERVQQLQLEISAARQEQALIQRQLEEVAARLENFQREIDNLQGHVEEGASQVQSLEARAAELSGQLEGLASRKLELESQVITLREREAEVGEELNDLRIRVATERQQRENLQRQREPMAARLHELAELIHQRSSDIENYQSRIAVLGAESDELRQGIAAWKEEQAQAEAEGQALLAQRSEIQENIDALETTLRVARKQLNDLQDRRGRHEIRTTQIELRMQNIREHVARRYSVNLDEFEPDSYTLLKTIKEHKIEGDNPGSSLPVETVDVAGSEQSPEMSPDLSEAPDWDAIPQLVPAAETSIPWERIEGLVEELTTRIDSIGPVNLDAIQEFEELEQRHAFLEQQNNDLINSKAELLEVIAKINVTTRELFAGTFEKIRVNFQEMFTELFGGGKANLTLTDESDPLESGIDIIAKPPGKQLQSVSLLSGGERTMTAVALLFSIYMVKPSPFCVLDEMDAPLDESNISRFVKILDRFVDQSQFVVITHNKRTIGRADMLYGVTMEEHGVSKLVSVKFRGREEDTSSAEAPSIALSMGKSEKLHSEQNNPSPTAEPVAI